MKKECQGAEFICPMEIRFDSQGGPIQETPDKKIDAWIQDIKKQL